jgi:predicted nucleic acid-binding protein
VILADTSAWVEYLRATGSPVDRRMDRLISADADVVVTTDVVVMELLAGATKEEELTQLRRMLLPFEHLPVDPLDDFETAAELYRQCRRGGETVRTLLDCLVAAVALRTGAAVLHQDRDYDAIARQTPLQIASADER